VAFFHYLLMGCASQDGDSAARKLVLHCVCDSVPTRLGEDHGDLETAVDVLNASAKSVL
jgi:hypothetical protein